MFNTLSLLAAEEGGNNGSMILMIVLIVVAILVIFVMPIFSNRKRQKEANEMLSSIEIGDEIMTLGGIMGTVVALSTHESGEKT